jgi:uncharacterized protein
MHRAFENFAAFVVRRRWLVLVALLAITAGLLSQARNLRMVIDPNALLPRDHPFVATTRTVEEVFGSKYVIVIGLRPVQGSAFQPKVVEQVRRITRALNETPGVVRSNLLSLSAKRAKDIQGQSDGMSVQPLDPGGAIDEKFLQRLREATLRNPVYRGTLISADETMTSILVEMKEHPNGYRAMMAPIEKILAEQKVEGVETFVGGNPVFLAQSERFSARMAFLFPIAIVLVGLIHFEAFRTLQGLFLPLLTAVLAVIWGLGAMGAAKVPLDVFNTPTPILILAVAAGHAVQLLKRYYEDFHRLVAGSPPGADRRLLAREAVVQSISQVGPVMAAAGLVAALGFFSLAAFPISTIRTFGIFTGTGILAALVIEMTLIPAVRSMLPAPGEKELRREASHGIWDRIPAGIADLVLGPRRQWVWWGTAALLVVSAVGMTRVHTDNANKSFFAASLPVSQDDTRLNDGLAGTNTIYLVLQGKAPDAMKDPAVLNAMVRIQARIEKEEGVGKTVSIADFLRRMNRAVNADQPAADSIPDTQQAVAQYLFLYSLSGDPGDFDAYVDYEYRRANIVLFLRTGSTAFAERLIQRLQTIASEELKGKVDFSIGGSVAQTAALTDVLVSGKLMNIAQLAAVIFVVAALLFRSLSAGLLVLVPLALTVFVNFGVMGWLGVPLNIPNSLSSAMAVGIGADYAIYLIFRLREECGKGLSLPEAVRNALAGAGKASLFVASAVAGGYSVLFLSIGFRVHNWLALLICSAMLVSVFAALLIIPMVAVRFNPRWLRSPSRPGKPTPATGILVLAIALTAPWLTGSAQAAEPDPATIMRRNLAVTKVSDSIFNTQIELINAQGTKRVRKTEGYTKLLPNGQDNMRLTRFTDPPDVMGTGVLLIEHQGADDDMWIWIPAVKKVRRLAASNKRDGFLGTDLSYGDVIGHRVEDWTHRVVREEALDGAACWVVESLPRGPEVQANSGYSKRLTWVRKDNVMTVKSDFWDESGQLFKQLQASGLEKVDEATQRWQAMRIEAKNLQTGHTTVVTMTKYKVNQNVAASTFSTKELARE